MSSSKSCWFGLIPTGVGNTMLMVSSMKTSRAHPHGCGEHCSRKCAVRTGKGSSPRVWGTLGTGGRATSARGLIPTGVGNTRALCPGSTCPWAHPHGCGEHTRTSRTRSTSTGSSPRVWGTRRSPTESDSRGRLIPTGVGNTRRVLLRGIRAPAHPHGCGEHSDWPDAVAGAYGSSPRVWGTLW